MKQLSLKIIRHLKMAFSRILEDIKVAIHLWSDGKVGVEKITVGNDPYRMEQYANIELSLTNPTADVAVACLDSTDILKSLVAKEKKHLDV